MVNTTSHKEPTMTTTATRAALRAALVSAVASAGFLAAAQSASALPINLPPVAKFTVNPNPVAATDAVLFSAATSGDIDGDVVRWEWDLNNDGVYETRSSVRDSVSHRFATPGPATVRLRVTDDDGARSTTSKTITVHRKPIALLTADRAVPNAGDVVGYRATGSYDPDPGGTITRYSWDLDGNGTFETSTGLNPFVTKQFATSGMHRLSVRVYDQYNAFGDATLNIRVNKRPAAVISATPNPAVMNEPVALSGALSSDDRGITKYEWDLDGNGSYETSTGTSPTTSTTFRALGQARIGLQVTDTDGATDQSAATITVNPVPAKDTTAPIVTISPTRVKMIDGTATFLVTCPATELRCATTLTLKGRVGALRGRNLGRASEMIPGGESLEITVPLNKKAKRKIRRTGFVLAKAVATATDDAGNVGTQRKNVRIRR
jgi:PKD repeat protein